MLLVVDEKRCSVSQLFVADLASLSLVTESQFRGARAAFSAAKVELGSHRCRLPRWPMKLLDWRNLIRGNFGALSGVGCAYLTVLKLGKFLTVLGRGGIFLCFLIYHNL